MALFRCQSGNGGGSAKSGTVTLTTNQEYSISTGLTSVTKFTIVIPHYFSSGGGQLAASVAMYDANATSSLYCAMAHNGENGGYATGKAIGTSAGNERLITIKSISGGTVTVVAPSNINFTGESTWYAE